MASKLAQRFEGLSFEKQLILLAVVFDPIGFAAGYLLGPSLGVDPFLGAAFGLVAANVPVSLHVLREASSQ
ncbi:hypothetical protein [Halobacterium sp. CBA1126]|uniref:hypothetical protein n=1 Tax=Halobacterium TaxID=2239 RepID=UPI0012FC3416|nr:hypothetical protein [Halobacterium sp. CBA1126]MUV61168.1 hypothetical protein [Halobacterium sp. CBA1126]